MQIIEASVLGTEAYKAGKPAAPALSSELSKMFEGRKFSETPEGEASTIDLMKAYTQAWNDAKVVEEYELSKKQS